MAILESTDIRAAHSCHQHLLFAQPLPSTSLQVLLPSLPLHKQTLSFSSFLPFKAALQCSCQTRTQREGPVPVLLLFPWDLEQSLCLSRSCFLICKMGWYPCYPPRRVTVCIRLPQACGGALLATSQMSLLDSESTCVKMLGEEDRKYSVSSLHSSCNGLAFIPEGEQRREPDPVHPGGRSNSRPSTIQDTYIAITVYEGGLPKGGHRLERGLAKGT